MLVKVNGEEINIPEKSTIQDAINKTKAPYIPGNLICLIKGQSELEGNVNKYRIKTQKGSIILELKDNEESKPLIDFWKDQYKNFEGLKVRWSNTNELAIGPIKSNFKPSKKSYNYKEKDVLLSLSGFSNDATHLIFAKDNIENVYGVPEGTGNGTFAKIIGGIRTLEQLVDDDKIEKIEPVIERKTITESSSISKLDTQLEEGNQLFTYCLFEANENSPLSVEQFFSVFPDDTINVSYDSNTFIGEYALEGIGKPPEEITDRERGIVTIRNTGKGKGRVYIYRENRVKSESHTRIGKIVKGMELVDIAKQGDKITLKSTPEPLKLLTKTQIQVEEELKKHNIKQERIGITDDDAIIVEQTPNNTLDIIKEGKVQTKGLNKDELILVKLFDGAPRTKTYFNKLTGLIEKPIGILKVYFAVKDMGIFMFEGDSNEAKGLLPENTPEGTVKAGHMGITNMSRKNVGVVGIRTEDNSEFGPTAEPFDGTNIFGEIVSDLDSISKLKDGDIVYIKIVD